MRHTLTFIVLILMIAAKAAWAEKTNSEKLSNAFIIRRVLNRQRRRNYRSKDISAYNNFAVENGFLKSLACQCSI